ncbi:MAG: ABC transporter ATP-binding protein [Thermoanaerobaculum sp.]
MNRERLGPPAVEAREAVIRYRAKEAVRGVSLAVARGEVVALVGADGAGKTSLLRAVAGLTPLAAGHLHVFALDPWKNRHQLHQHLGYVAQTFALYGDLTVDENLAFIGHLMGLPDFRQRRQYLLERLGLAPFRDRRAQALSGGMKQKLALAASLMHDPQILVLDEPTTGVDPLSRREFWQLLGEFVAQGLTVLFATAYLDDAQRADRVVLFHDGKVLAEGSPEVLARQFPFRIAVVAGEPRELLRRLLVALPGVVHVQPFAAGFHVYLDPQAPVPDPGFFGKQGVSLTGLDTIPPSIEDVFLAKLSEIKGGGTP